MGSGSFGTTVGPGRSCHSYYDGTRHSNRNGTTCRHSYTSADVFTHAVTATSCHTNRMADLRSGVRTVTMGPDPLEYLAAEAFALWEQHAGALGLTVAGTPWPETRSAVRECWRRTLAGLIANGSIEHNDWLG